MKSIVLLLIPLFFVACTTYNSENSYYGYDNSTKVIEDEDELRLDDSGWTNPMANSSNDGNVQRVERVDRNQYNGPVYVPVIVPWWNGYYSWGHVPRRRRGYYIHYSNYWGPEWYSPWYSYHPYHGVTWYDYWYVRPHHRYWHSSPVSSYTDRPIRRSQSRNFGNTRGTYSVYNPRTANRTITNTRDYNPRTERYTSNGESVFRRGENYEVRSGNRNNSNSSNVRSTSTRSSSSRSTYSQPSNSNSSPSSNSNSRGSSNVSKPSNSNSRSSGSSSRSSGSSSRSGGSRTGNSRGK